MKIVSIFFIKDPGFHPDPDSRRKPESRSNLSKTPPTQWNRRSRRWSSVKLFIKTSPHCLNIKQQNTTGTSNLRNSKEGGWPQQRPEHQVGQTHKHHVLQIEWLFLGLFVIVKVITGRLRLCLSFDSTQIRCPCPMPMPLPELIIKLLLKIFVSA